MISLSLEDKNRFPFRRHSILLMFLVTVTLTGCTLDPTYRRPEILLPPLWRNGVTGVTEVHSVADLKWWQLFQDQGLQEIIDVALHNNNDLQLAITRVAEARALLGLTRSAQFPQLDVGARYQNQRLSETSFPPIDKLGVNPDMDIFRIDLDLSFEIDLQRLARFLLNTGQDPLCLGKITATDESELFVKIL